MATNQAVDSREGRVTLWNEGALVESRYWVNFGQRRRMRRNVGGPDVALAEELVYLADASAVGFEGQTRMLASACQNGDSAKVTVKDVYCDTLSMLAHHPER